MAPRRNGRGLWRYAPVCRGRLCESVRARIVLAGFAAIGLAALAWTVRGGGVSRDMGRQRGVAPQRLACFTVCVEVAVRCTTQGGAASFSVIQLEKARVLDGVPAAAGVTT